MKAFGAIYSEQVEDLTYAFCLIVAYFQSLLIWGSAVAAREYILVRKALEFACGMMFCILNSAVLIVLDVRR